MDLYRELCDAAGVRNVLADEPMSRHTTFRIGGPADYFVSVSSVEEIRKVLEACRRHSAAYYIMGNGSDLLVGDKGYRGVIIQLFKRMNGIRVDGERICAQAGALLSKTASAACRASLTGMEFASGIPGTLGGALRMNAGAYGGGGERIVGGGGILSPAGGGESPAVGEVGGGGGPRGVFCGED